MANSGFYRRVIAIFIMLNCVCILSLYLGVLLGFQFWPFLALWLAIGIFVGTRKGCWTDLPDGSRIDFLGAVKLLYSAAKWPLLL